MRSAFDPARKITAQAVTRRRILDILDGDTCVAQFLCTLPGGARIGIDERVNYALNTAFCD